MPRICVTSSRLELIRLLQQRCTQRVSYALETGKLHKPGACEIYGAMGKKLQAHHGDYSKALDVIFACHSCHKKLAKIIRENQANLASRLLRDSTEASEKDPGQHIIEFEQKEAEGV